MRYNQIKPLAEGGNIFKAPNFSKEDPQMLTDRINKAEVIPTVEYLEVMTGIPVADCMLGSTGIAASSGDIDVGIDKNKYTKDGLMDHMLEQGVDPDHLSKTGDSVHYMSPIWGPNGEKTDRFVQVDFMFVPDVEFAKWSMRTAPDSSYKGVYLQKLRNDLVKTADPNWKWHHFQGVLQRSDNANVFGSDPDKIAKGLIGPKATKADLESVERILAAIKEHRGDINTQVRDTYRATLAPKKPGEKPDPNAPVIDEAELSKHQVIDLFVRQGKSQSQGAAAYERGYRGSNTRRIRRKNGGRRNTSSNNTKYWWQEKDNLDEAKIGQAARAHTSSGSKVGREFQHIEDLVYVEGLPGIKRALERLAQIASNAKPLEVKWDGSPAIIVGRDETGKFHFGDKYAKQMLSTPQEVYNYYTRTSQSDSRKQFAQEMAELCPVYEEATPQNFRGFLEAGLMYKSTPPLNDNGEYHFMPNTVEYFVQQDTPLGKRIGNSTSGAAATGFFDNLPELGGKRGPVGDRYKAFNGTRGVVIIPPKFTESGTPVDLDKLRTISRYAASNGGQIEQFLAPEAGLSDIRSIIYSYVNSQVDNPENLDRLGQNFAGWVESNPKLSPAKKLKLTQRMTDNARGASAVFKITQAIMHIKDGIIGNKERETLASMGIRAQMKTGEHGGEGFVHDPEAGTGPTKLVNRGTFTRANRLREAPEPKNNLLSFTVQPMKPRNRVAQDMMDRNGPYKPKQVKSVVKYQRREKHRNRNEYESSSQNMKEAAEQPRTAVVGWGRGMGHSGHMLLAGAVIEYAKATGAQPFFFVSETVGEDDPLLPEEKLAIYKKVFPKHKDIFKTCNTVTAAVGQIHEAGFTSMVLVVGEDQKKSFGFLSRGPQSPDRIPVKVLSRQDVARELDLPELNAEGPRATPMREILKDVNATTEQKFEYWRDAMPKALSDSQVMKIMKLAAARMKFPIDDAINEADQPPQGSLFSPLSAANRRGKHVDPRLKAKQARAARKMSYWMGHRD